MDDNTTKRGWNWPLAFFILNLAAIIAWFVIYPGLFRRELSIVSLSPKGIENNPDRVTEIRLEYSLPLDPASVGGDAIRLIPPVQGTAELTVGNAVRFLPRQPLRNATAYTVVPSPTIRGERGEIPKPELLEFSTARFVLEGAEQVGYDRNAYDIELTFNQPVSSSNLSSALMSRFSVPDRSGGADRVKVVTNSVSRRQRLRVNESRECHLLLTLPAGFCGNSGPLGLAEDAKILLQIQDPADNKNYHTPEWAQGLAAVELKPEVSFLGMTSEWDDGEGCIRVRTTSPLDPSRAAGFVVVSPALPITFTSTWNGIKIQGDFEPGKQYRVTLNKGIPSSYGGDLKETITRQVWFDDLPSTFSFPSGGGFLSPDGLLTVPVKSRNVDSLNLEIRRLYASNIVETLLKEYGGDIEPEYSEPEISHDIAVKSPRNETRETLLDLRELVGERPLGVYGLEIRNKEYRWNSRSAVVAISDIGLGVRQGRHRLMAWTTSLRDAEPRRGVKIGVYTNKRQLLSEGRSDADGIVILDIPPLPESERVALVLAEGEGDEFSYVLMDKDNRSRGDEARLGAHYPEGYEIFLAAERGVYRGGETVMLTGLARDEFLETAPGLPLELRLFGPDRKHLRTVSATADTLGRFTADVPLAEGYPGGIYSIESRLPGQEESIGSAMFRIADYLPETLSIAMELREEKKDGDDERDAENSLMIKVSRLAGGELGAVPVTVLASYTAQPFQPKKWTDWRFGDKRLSGRHVDRRERHVDLDQDGSGTTEWSNPELTFPGSALMTVRVEARDMGGRAASESMSRVVHGVPYYVGVLLPDRIIPAGTETVCRLAAVRPDGEAADDAKEKWTASLMRIEYASVMKRRQDGRLYYQWHKKEISEAVFSGTWKDGESEIRLKPVAGGQYELIVEAGSGRSCVTAFSVSGHGAEWHGEDPELLALIPDRDVYAVGDTAVVATTSPFAGLALVTVETKEVMEHRLIEFKEGENSFDIPVIDGMRPNAHIGVTLIRAVRPEEEWRPHRLSGTAVIRVDNADRRLLVQLDAPEAFSPGKTSRVAVTVTKDGEPVANAPVVLWGVDVGVLSLTGYKTPSPWEAFYRQRRSAVTEADMFSRLAPELSGWIKGDPSPGGGDAYGELGRRLNPVFANRVRAAIVHDFVLATDENGVASADLAIPEFAGRLRLMCWTASGESMGAAEQEVEVKAPVSVSAAWPRFGAPGDRLEIPVTVINRSGADGAVTVAVDAGDNLTVEPAETTLELGDGKTGLIRFTAVCGDAGVATAAVTATLRDDSFTERVEFSIRPPMLFSREAGLITIGPGETRAIELAPNLMPKNSRVRLVAGGHPAVHLAGSLDYLLNYPYGCAEQTASRLLSLVYLPDLLALTHPGQVESGEVETLATACIERLQMMQNYNGAIKMWPQAGEELFWVSAQAMYSLMESRAVGHPVPDSLVDNLARFLNSRLEDRLDAEELKRDDGESAAMACLGLARAHKLQRSWLLRFQELAEQAHGKNKPLSSAALAFLCEAVAAAGDVSAAKELYARYKPGGPEAGVSLNRVVELGAWLTTSMALGLDADEQATYATELGSMLDKGFTRWSTKENGLILTALGRYWQKVGPLPEATALLRRDGRTTRFSTRKGGSWDKLPAGAKIDLENPAEGSLRLFWLAEGVPLDGVPKQEDVGMTARRRLFDSQGREVSEPFVLNRGEVYEVRLTVTGEADDLVLADLLPAGLEIEDAALKGRKLSGKATKDLSIKNVEIRDDRLLVFASVHGSGEYRYLARAVTGGAFVWPALDASRMYDAATRSVHGSGTMTVKDKEAVNH